MGEGTALLLIDLQNDFCHPDGIFHASGRKVERLNELIQATNQLIAAARAAARPIIWAKMVWDDDEALGLISRRSPFLARSGLRRGTWGAEILADLDTAPSDIFVEKTRFSAFYKTSLENILQKKGIARLISGGVRTDFCVESTVRDAYFRDIDVIVVADACGGYVREMHDASLRLMDTVFSRVVALNEAIALFEDSKAVGSV